MAINIEIVYAPALYDYHTPGGTVVLIDVARFTSTMITALANGAISAETYPDYDTPRRLKAEHGYVICGEERGLCVPGFDFNNSPILMTKENVMGHQLAFTTSNGTYMRSLVKDFDAIYAGAFVNLEALVNRLIADDKNVKLVCSGRARNVAVEDLIFAGCVASMLVDRAGATYHHDTVPVAISLWSLAKNDPLGFVLKNSPSVAYRYGKTPDYKADIDEVFKMSVYDIVPEEIAPLKFAVKN